MPTFRLFCALLLLLTTGIYQKTYAQGTVNRLVIGRVYLDTNGNSFRDTSERPFPIPIVIGNTLGPEYATDSVSTGIYMMPINAAGPYQVAVLQPPLHYRLTQGATGYNGNMQSPIQTDTGRTFGLTPISGREDVRVSFASYSAARVGRILRYRARVENVGTTTLGQGQVTLSMDGAMSVIGALPAPTTRLTWNFTNLRPFEARDYEVRVTLPVTMPVGTHLFSSASVVGSAVDFNPFDNVDSLQQEVVSSFDPNCITVNHTLLSTSQVQAGAPLDYLIQFENLGNDTAFAVTIVDSLPAQLLQLGTLQMLGSSHNCMWQVTGDGQLMLGFPRIRLPYQAIDALLSTGFVRFRLKPRPTLGIGTIIPNVAHITFDFNPPLATNDVTTLVGSPTATPSLLAEQAGWALYPNPATSMTSLEADIRSTGLATLTLLDGLGRVIQTTTHHLSSPSLQRLPLDLRGVVPGMYVVRLALPDGNVGTRRLVVK
jgi:uncharacterized repeat protein (TIGR01451 family)